MTRLIRVFPRRTRATPDDALAYVGPPDLFAEADEVHVSVTFTWDKARAEQLAEQWRWVAPVKLGGVAYGDTSLAFIPGQYVKAGYTITSRGCPERCFFCSVWKRWPTVNLLPIYDGWNILDDNLLACPREHVEAVFAMLRRQQGRWRDRSGRSRGAEFSGGIQPARLEDWHVDLFASLSPRPNVFFAYDPGDKFEDLESAAHRMLAAGFTRESHRLRSYVLIGHPKDTLAAATARLTSLVRIGITPFAMLYKPETQNAVRLYTPGPEWRTFHRGWARPAAIHASAA